MNQMDKLARKLKNKTERLQRLKESAQKIETEKDTLEKDIQAMENKLESLQMGVLKKRLQEFGISIADVDLDKAALLLAEQIQSKAVAQHDQQEEKEEEEREKIPDGAAQSPQRETLPAEEPASSNLDEEDTLASEEDYFVSSDRFYS